MSEDAARSALDAVYRSEARRVRATLIRLLGGFDAAEEALHDAFAAAAVSWPRDGIPANPRAWLVSTGRFRTVDRWRRQGRVEAVLPEVMALMQDDAPLPEEADIRDDELRLIFTCCHPRLPSDGRVALTLREVGGLTTEEIARAWLVPVATIAQRIVRAKARIRDGMIPYTLPERAELADRTDSVLQVIYLIFNEGYAATGGPDLVRPDLCAEAIRLGRLVVGLLDDSESLGLLALMLLHASRQVTRVDAAGDMVRLEDQDRALWDRKLIAEAQALIARALASKRVGPYLLQAAIADCHARAGHFAETDWTQIVGLYDVLLRLAPSPVVALNRAVAVAQRDGAEAGRAAVEGVMAQGGLDDYHLAHAAHADMLARCGYSEKAEASYRRAMGLTQQAADRRFLAARIAALKP